MKPRRENGATLVSPMTSGVSTGSARISLLLLLKVFFWSKAVPIRSRTPKQPKGADWLGITRGRQITSLRERANKKAVWSGIKNKAAGAVYRRRPCQPPEIKIGLRLPV